MASSTKRVSCIITQYAVGLHADVLATKILEGYHYDYGEKPNLELASIYVDQFTKDDISRDLPKKFGVPLFKTIEEALTLGGRTLAVDGVIIIGEHGDYPTNAKRQKLHPRRRFFEETVKVFEKSKRVVPVFNDKHLEYAWADAKWMFDKARELHIPFLAGSTIPLTFRKPALHLPRHSELTEAFQIGYSDLEYYGFHTLEALQCMAERRKGFETGIIAVQALQGEAMWRAFDAGGWSKELLDTAVGIVPDHQAGDFRALTAKSKEAALYFLWYNDGFKAVVGMLNGWVGSGKGTPFAFAGKIRGQAKPAGCQFYVQEPYPYIHFGYLLRAIEFMVQTGQPPYPVERTLLTTGALDALMTSLYEKGKRIETPHLAIKYEPTDWPFATDPLPKTFPHTDRQREEKK